MDLPSQLALEQLPKMLIIDGAICWLQASVAPCECWVVSYYSYERQAIPHRFFAHKKSLMDAIGELRSTVDLIKIFG